MMDGLGALFVVKGLDIMQDQGKLTEEDVRSIVRFAAQTYRG